MNRATLAVLALLAACSTTLTPVQFTAAEAGITIASSLVPGGQAALALGQVLCSDGSSLLAGIDAITGQPWLVTGKAATTVANACAAIGSSFAPVAPPTTPTTVGAAKVSA